MRDFALFMIAIAWALVILAWLSLLPTIGLLWLVGWL